MNTINLLGAQGDVIFMRVPEIPENAIAQPEADEYVVAHSETGHHHVARRHGRPVTLYSTPDPLVSYLEFCGGNQTIEHLRSHDTHATLELLQNTENTLKKIDEALDTPARFKIVRQRQQTPEGWQRVVD